MSEQHGQQWRDLPWRRKRLRQAEFDYSDQKHVYFVTVCARHLGQPFVDSLLTASVVESILHLSKTRHWRAYVYCLMPDHLHLAVSPEPDSGGLFRLLQQFKSYTTRTVWRQGHRGALWQRSYYDHVARREEDVIAICRYILENPVRKGLVEEADHWPYSGLIDPLPG